MASRLECFFQSLGPALVFCILLPACGSSPSGDDTGETGASTGDVGTGEPVPCEQIDNEADCMAAPGDGSYEFGCEWGSAYIVERNGDVCSAPEEVGVCISGSWQNGAAGCVIAEGCEDGPLDSPFYMEQDGNFYLYNFCGGTPPSYLTACPSGLASEAAPPECACACELSAE